MSVRKTITFAIDAKGNRKEILDIDVPDKKHRAYFQQAKIGALPKGAVRIEVYQMIRQTVGMDVAARDTRLTQEAEAAEAGQTSPPHTHKLS